jgi:hypothetical protein
MLFMVKQCVREDRVDLREGRLVRDDGGVDPRGCRARLQSDIIREEHSGGWQWRHYARE